jgi:hypothetical protein
MSMGGPSTKWRFRFTLRAFLIVIAIIALWLGWNVRQVKQRQQAEKYILSKSNKIFYGLPEKPWRRSTPLVWRVLGAKPVQVIDLRFGGTFLQKDVDSIRALFPEADINHKLAK